MAAPPMHLVKEREKKRKMSSIVSLDKRSPGIGILTRSITNQEETVRNKVADIITTMDNKHDIRQLKPRDSKRTTALTADPVDRQFTGQDACNLVDIEGRLSTLSIQMSALLIERKQLLLVKKDPAMGVGRSAFIGHFFDLNKGCSLVRSNNLLPVDDDITALIIGELFSASFDMEREHKAGRDKGKKVGSEGGSEG